MPITAIAVFQVLIVPSHLHPSSPSQLFPRANIRLSAGCPTPPGICARSVDEYVSSLHLTSGKIFVIHLHAMVKGEDAGHSREHVRQ